MLESSNCSPPNTCTRCFKEFRELEANLRFCDFQLRSPNWNLWWRTQSLLVQTRIFQSKHVSTAQSPSQSCVYHIEKMNLISSDAGTYYCAVASCGEILFGSGSELLIKDDVEDPMTQIRVLVWLSIIRTGILLCLNYCWLLCDSTEAQHCCLLLLWDVKSCFLLEGGQCWLIGQSVHGCDPIWNISTAIGWLQSTI